VNALKALENPIEALTWLKDVKDALTNDKV
jgi:hypothetical protein